MKATDQNSHPQLYTPAELAQKMGQHIPTDEQADVIQAELKPLLVVAGAGSGKTATMSQRVVYQVANQMVRPENILGLTFTRKATAELAGRVGAQLEELAKVGLVKNAHEQGAPTISTYNSFAGSLVREHGINIGLEPGATMITDARKWQIALQIAEQETEPLPLDTPGQTARSVLQIDAALNENLLSITDAYSELTELAQLLQGYKEIPKCGSKVGKAPENVGILVQNLRLVEKYRAYKQAHDLLDFGDQVALACKIVAQCPQVIETYKHQFSAVFLDEFQDTSVAQIKLLSALFSGSGVTAVGDPNQAIYGWRGASAGALDSFHEFFNPGGDAKVLPLSTAWRNDLRILAVANQTSLPLRSHQFQDGDSPVEHIAVAPLRARSKNNGVQEGTVAGAFLAHPLQEAETIAAFLAQHWTAQTSMAVLCRSRAQFLPIIQALEEKNLPVSVVDLGGLLSLPEVADIQALLAVAANPERGDQLIRLLTRAGVGAKDIQGLFQFARRLASHNQDKSPVKLPDDPLLSEAVAALLQRVELPTGEPQLSDVGKNLTIRVADAIARVQSALALPLPELVVFAEHCLQLDLEVAARLNNPLGRKGLDRFRAVAEEFSYETEDPTVDSFLAWLEAAQDEENGLSAPQIDPEPGSVQILTIHASKGLEWDIVAVSGLAEKNFPSYKTTPQADYSVIDSSWLSRKGIFPYPLRADADTLPPFKLGELEPAQTDKETFDTFWDQYTHALGRYLISEERRLAYVAFTRARHQLFLSGSHLIKGGKTPVPMSRFLLEQKTRDLVEPYGPGWTAYDESVTNPLHDAPPHSQWPAPTGSQLSAEDAARAAAAASITKLLAAGNNCSPESLENSDDSLLAQWASDAALLLAEREQAQNALPSVRLPKHLAATKMDELRADPKQFALDLRRPVPAHPYSAGRLGTVFHAAIAQHLDARGTLFDLTEAGVPDSLTSADRALINKWLENVQNLSILTGYTLYSTETEQEILLSGVAIRCRIDAIFRHTDGSWLILDWKTGHHKVPVDQLSLYVHAWAQSRHSQVSQIRAAYVYVDSGEVAELTSAQLLSLGKLAEAISPQ